MGVDDDEQRARTAEVGANQVAQSGMADEDSSGGASPSDLSQEDKTGHDVAVEGQNKASATNLMVRRKFSSLWNLAPTSLGAAALPTSPRHNTVQPEWRRGAACIVVKVLLVLADGGRGVVGIRTRVESVGLPPHLWVSTLTPGPSLPLSRAMFLRCRSLLPTIMTGKRAETQR